MVSSSRDFVNVTRQHPCPICDKPDWCSYSPGRNVVYCRRVGEPGKEKYDKNGVPYWIHPLDGEVRVSSPIPVIPSKTAIGERAAPGILDEVYRFILERLPLYGRHSNRLVEKYGIPETEIKARGYRTWIGPGKYKIAQRCIERFGEEICAQVPGFIHVTQKDGVALNSPYWSFAGSMGIAIPVRNLANQIIAIKIRKDKESQGGKYSYLSSRWHGGPSPGSSVHIPYHPGIAHLVAQLTEGELKADSITLRTGILTLSIPGVGSWELVIPPCGN